MSVIRSLLRGAVVCGFALSAAACASSPRYPVEDGQVEGTGGFSPLKPRYPVRDEATTPSAAPSAAPAANKAPVRLASAAPSRAASAVTEQPLAPPPAPRPEPRPVPVLPPRDVTVSQGDTIYDVAARYRSPVRAIIDLNRLEPPYALRGGQHLQIPTPAAYEVQEGDTLFALSRRFTVDPRSLASLNDLTLQSRLRVGQRILLPPGAVDQGADQPARFVPPPEPARTADAGRDAAGKEPSKPKRSRTSDDAIRAAQNSITASPLGSPLPDAVDDAEAVAAGKGRFVWPVRGTILSGFGPKSVGQRNEGLDIAADLQTPVMAAADGEVVYAGSSIPGLGNLVLLKHPEGWITAYSHLSKFVVKNREMVIQGQTIGYVGQTGAATEPMLHFETRYAPTPKDKAKPIDPAKVLPK